MAQATTSAVWWTSRWTRTPRTRTVSNYVVTRVLADVAETATPAVHHHPGHHSAWSLRICPETTPDCAADDAAVLTATDNCSTVIFTADTVGDCNRYRSRAGSVADECGNGNHTQVGGGGRNAPVFNGVACRLDVGLSADDAAVLTASDNCSDVEVIFTADRWPTAPTVTRSHACGL